MLRTQHLPAPESYYTSPLTRCLQTAALTFDVLALPADRAFAPVVKERLREVLGVHTCDRRSSRSRIREMYPEWQFEDGFAEEDPLWEADVRESPEAQDVRTRELLDDVFGSDGKTYVSFSSHSGEIASVLRGRWSGFRWGDELMRVVIGHRKFELGTGHVIPVLVKAETVYGTRPATSIPPSTPVSTCTAPPATSTL
jgi:broad specificity phosphatase PhoE